MATLSSKYVEKVSSWNGGDAGGEMELYWFAWAPFSWGESPNKTTKRENNETADSDEESEHTHILGDLITFGTTGHF